MFKCSSSYKHCVYCGKAQKAGAFFTSALCGGMFYFIYHNSCTLFDNGTFWKAAEDSRNLEKSLADANVSKSVKIYETFIALVKIVIDTGLFVCLMTIVTNGSFSDIAGIGNEFYKLGCISGILSGTILVIDMVRTIGGRNEYFHTV